MSSIAVQMLPIATISAVSYVRQQNGHDKESLSQLAASISQHGLLQPIVVRPEADAAGIVTPDRWIVIAGRRRLAACKLAGLDHIPALVTDTDEARSYEMEIAENIQREQMTLADTARAVRTMMAIYDNARKVATILNKSPAWVSKHLSVTSSKCPPAVADLMDRGIVTDLETLILLRQIAETPVSNPAAAPTMTRMLRIAHEGNMNRQIARDALLKLRSPAPSTPPALVKTRDATFKAVQPAAPPNDDAPATSFCPSLPVEYFQKLLTLCEMTGADSPAACITALIDARLAAG
ncbi:MAG TPA: ParB/RepB/Spo0J family partition protein [Burkholderiales bacterium]|nr:ParB/RepB/Spo0J family partition protein [Burkholderiales bacterium]